MTGNLAFDIGGVRTEVRFVPEVSYGEAAVAVFDANTVALFGRGAPSPVTLSAGESAKRWESVQTVLERCAAIGMERDDVIAGIGGGVVCDVTAFAASVYMRGCGLLLSPTTLLAMVDASLGGKTGIDFLGFKNLVGTFYPASRILIAASAVRTLPEREYRSGLAEVIKTALIGDAELWALLREQRALVQSREPDVVAEMIRRSLVVKGRIVQEDPRESGNRVLLNLGHTFGHALESATGFDGWTHGEAVAWGMGRALAAGERMGVTERGFAAEVRSLLDSYGFRLDVAAGAEALAAAFRLDKKRRAGQTRLVIPHALGDVRAHEVPDEEVAKALGASGAKRRTGGAAEKELAEP